jgi:hypothetical protein
VSFAAVSAVSAAESPTRYDFRKQLLVVDWNTTYTNQNAIFGLRRDTEILNFYQHVIPEGLTLAEQLRQAWYNNPNSPLGYIPDEIDPNDVEWYSDKDLNDVNRVPYDYIRQFKWVLVIAENPPTSVPDPGLIYPRLRVFMNYMDAGGQVMMTGRRLFMGVFGISQNGTIATGPGRVVENFLHYYMNLSTLVFKEAAISSPSTAIADFGGVTTTDQYLEVMDLDTAVAHSIRYGSWRFYCTPEIDYFGRNNGSSGYDVSTTMFNYASCTALDTYNIYNEDCTVLSFDTTQSFVYLTPINNHTRILNCTRIRNVTKGVTAEFIRSDQRPAGVWRIIASVPSGFGAWTDEDVLEVDYSYIPIQPSHDQPVAINYNKIQGVVRYNAVRGIYTFEGQTRFRSSLFCFPLSFMKNDTVDATFLPGVRATKVGIALSSQAIFFNYPRVIREGGAGKR